MPAVANSILSPVIAVDTCGNTGCPSEVGPIVSLDESYRFRSLYGPVFERLGVEPVHGNGKTPEEILAIRPSVILLSREWTHDMRATTTTEI